MCVRIFVYFRRSNGITWPCSGQVQAPVPPWLSSVHIQHFYLITYQSTDKIKFLLHMFSPHYLCWKAEMKAEMESCHYLCSPTNSSALRENTSGYRWPVSAASKPRVSSFQWQNEAVTDRRLHPGVATWGLLWAHVIFLLIYTQGHYLQTWCHK